MGFERHTGTRSFFVSLLNETVLFKSFRSAKDEVCVEFDGERLQLPMKILDVGHRE